MKTISLKSYFILSDWDENWYGGTVYLPLTAPKISSKSDNVNYHFHHAKDFSVGLQNCGLKESVIGFYWAFCLWRYGWNNEKSMTVLKLFPRSIFWALFQRSKLSFSSNNPEKNKKILKLSHFLIILMRHSKGTCKNHRKKFPNLTKIELASEDTQFRRHLNFQGNRTKSSIILAIMKFLANFF